jgi:hypothetical protein
MAISQPGVLREVIGGRDLPLLLRNGEIERFEERYEFGVFALWDQLLGRGSPPQVRHVRDLVALGLVGGGMSDREADRFLADLAPGENLSLRAIAQRLLGVTFLPMILEEAAGKKSDGSDGAAPDDPTGPDDMTPEAG